MFVIRQNPLWNQSAALSRSEYLVTRHEDGISVLVSKTSFRWRTSVVVFSCEILIKKKVQVRQSKENS